MQRKKIISILIKALVGIASCVIIYSKIKSDLTPANLGMIRGVAFSAGGLFSLFLCLLLVPVNWGLESYKWRLITKPIQNVSFKTATKSVYSGVCLGNLAPGRSTEFLAKIFFFKPENRPVITVLHFVNGMFQFSLTIVVGFFALLFKLNDFDGQYSYIAYMASVIGLLVLVFLAICIYKIDPLLHFISKKISKRNQLVDFKYRFQNKTIFTLFGFSMLRYTVFYSQLSILISLFHPGFFSPATLIGTALYFLISSVLPMISFLEAAIRSAIALVVFKNTGIAHAHIALAVVVLWFMNIVLPSIAGYYFLLKQNFNFRLATAKK